MSTCIFSLRHSRKLTFAALVLCTVSAFAQALPIVQGMQERSAALAKDVYNDSSSSSTGECTMKRLCLRGLSSLIVVLNLITHVMPMSVWPTL